MLERSILAPGVVERIGLDAESVNSLVVVMQKLTDGVFIALIAIMKENLPANQAERVHFILKVLVVPDKDDMIFKLTYQQKKIYNTILNNLQQGKLTVNISCIYNNDDISTAFTAIKAERPEYFYVKNNYTIWSSRTTKSIKLESNVPVNQINDYAKSLRDCANKIIDDRIRPEMNSVQKALILHDFLTETVTYEIPNEKAKNEWQFYCAYGALINKRAVCSGISSAYSYLLHLLGIEATMISGNPQKKDFFSNLINKNEDHAWNIVCLENQYYHIDVTWDLPSFCNTHVRMNLYDYFCLNDEDLKGRQWKRNHYPCCTEQKYNFFFSTNAIAHNDAEAKMIITRQAKSDYKILYFRCVYMDALGTKNEIIEHFSGLIRSDKKLSLLFMGTLWFSVREELRIVCIGCE